ncbi:hypothetical protein QL285_019177 [Trifolium repens]|nr:hypothetical protein QL285_019177 [Trifolium repens]
MILGLAKVVRYFPKYERTKNELVYFIWNCAMDAAISTQDIKSACAKLLASLTRSIGSFISNYVIVRDPKRNNIRVSIEKRVRLDVGGGDGDEASGHIDNEKREMICIRIEVKAQVKSSASLNSKGTILSE